MSHKCWFCVLMTRADAWVTLGEGERVEVADAVLVLPQTLVIHSVAASFSRLLLRYYVEDDT